MITTSIHVINPSLYASLPYDPIKDFAPVGTIYTSEFVLIAANTVPASTVQELIALAKAKPNYLNYATTGAGGSAHLASEMFNMLAGIRTQHVPFKGAGAVGAALLSGQVHLFFSNPLAVMPHIQSGRVKPIAVTGEARIPALPQVPTFVESGLRGLDVRPWFCVLAPAATPKPIVDKLSAEFVRIVGTQEIRDYMAKQGIIPFSSTPEQLSSLMKSDLAKYAKVIKAANIKLEQ
jgi:tripartite-type tricarboxylate transporter receptor subunit TctC